MLKLTKEEEIKLWEDYVKRNDKRALMKLKISLRPLIKSFINQQTGRNSDVDQYQLAARVDAELPGILKKYDPALGFELSTFVGSQIRGHILNAARENQLEVHIPRTEADSLLQYRKGLESAKVEFGTTPTDEQVLPFTNFSNLNELKKAKRYFVTTTIGDELHSGEEGGAIQFKDQFISNGFKESDLKNSMKLFEIKKLMNELNAQDKRIVEDYVFNSKKITEIALSLGLSSSQVRQVINNWKQKVREKGF